MMDFTINIRLDNFQDAFEVYARILNCELATPGKAVFAVNSNGSVKVISTDTIQQRPAFESYAAPASKVLH